MFFSFLQDKMYTPDVLQVLCDQHRARNFSRPGDVLRKPTSKGKYFLELIKRGSKVHQENISCDHALHFDQ